MNKGKTIVAPSPSLGSLFCGLSSSTIEANGSGCGCGLELVSPGLSSSLLEFWSLLGIHQAAYGVDWTVIEGTVQAQTVGLEPVRLKGIPLTSRFIGTQGCVFNKGLFGVFHAILSVVGTTADFTWGSDFVYLGRLCQSKMSFHQALDLIFELD
ncbi:hypothetical protein Tco_0780617 [Tanacetum coccineum]